MSRTTGAEAAVRVGGAMIGGGAGRVGDRRPRQQGDAEEREERAARAHDGFRVHQSAPASGWAGGPRHAAGR